MTRILSRLLGRLPLGWLQLVSNRLRFAAAAAGVAFAGILVFVQLGMMGAFSEAIRVTYSGFEADVMISASDATGIMDGSNVASRRMYQALGVPGVTEACPLFVGMTKWQNDNGTNIEFNTIGIDPARQSFIGTAIGNVNSLKLANNVLLDRRARGMESGQLSQATLDSPLVLEANNQQLAVVGTVSFGGGFSGDGFMVVSDQTFMRLFPARFSGAPNHILLKIGKGEDPGIVVDRIRTALNAQSLEIRTIEAAIEQDVQYQTTVRPVGLIFGMGVIIGIIVGIVIVYQILSTDVADHLREYATFKAMGYDQRYFRSIIFEEAIILAIAGFIPALLVALGIYTVMAEATGLPIAMNLARAAAVFVGTVGSCALSGMIAMRKLANADPADLF
ncbi:ABC transporter permease DevC [Mariniblastus fucicola]|uniref:FtsX-like permease family protein n=1 Tax=Mariniblastus fucicola TaxID=980251 RepID=A0A5B9PD37_9BACT|nr:ABC transporter permease DevC [Mariniblastus fucicola]QEG22476.1 FtsX-like permease family protein [Mariniblastus fucicola]